MNDEQPTDADALAALRTLVAWVAPMLRASTSTSSAIYTSRSLPPGVSHRAFNVRCASIPEARKDGRIWRVSVDAYERALKRPRLHANVAPQRAPKPDDSVEALLAQAGLRLGPKAKR